RARTAPGHDHRAPAQGRVVALLHRRVERVHVHVDDLALGWNGRGLHCPVIVDRSGARGGAGAPAMAPPAHGRPRITMLARAVHRPSRLKQLIETPASGTL